MRFINMLKYHLYPNIINLILSIFPNFKLTNKIRGKLFSPLFKRSGSNLQIASGVIINMHRNISVGDNVYIAHNVWINGSGGLEIHDNVIISPNVIIATTKHERVNNKVSNTNASVQPIYIGKGCWIAGNSTITMGVSIANGCIVSANSLVNKTIKEENKLIGGVPAKIIKSIGD
ncbi:acyltransferase [Staphylococcus hominis]|uniref:acyltransferase n=1 Tax=Staphylococcus hominis TaxID=1290 RepID=UPI00115D1439|nr:acyltransferase [Staphylococcus hominis]MBF2307039.1 acyltransferase [Staphylococcus hominis]MBF2315674.1 acyltransferase [Staphylococcus hominis]MBF2320278.1 acyltransferase [Staphylococcus hominis]MDS3887726.1 acyltransferase [Staphylococcus hominis]TRL62986.1 acyltransferase [Staphylococcus hominis]